MYDMALLLEDRGIGFTLVEYDSRTGVSYTYEVPARVGTSGVLAGCKLVIVDEHWLLVLSDPLRGAVDPCHITEVPVYRVLFYTSRFPLDDTLCLISILAAQKTMFGGASIKPLRLKVAPASHSSLQQILCVRRIRS
jgi:hypothetical protein